MTRLSPLRSLASVVLLGVLVSPAAAQQSGKRGCRSSDLRPGEKPMDAFVDSATLAAALAPSWEAAWGRVFATVSSDSTGEKRVRVLSRSPHVEGLDRVGQWLQTATRDFDPSSGVQLFLGDEDGYAARSIQMAMCAPQLVNERELVDKLVDWGRENRPDPAADARSVRAGVWLYVSVLGTVIQYELREPSGWEAFDDFVRYMMLTAEFAPAETEGVPTAVWVSMPVTYTRGATNPFSQGEYGPRDGRRRGGGG